jgi:hypothetical protein
LNTDELVPQANEICARYREREAPLRAAMPRDDSPESYRRVGELLPQLAALVREQIEELRKLEAPAELEPRSSTASRARLTCSTKAARQRSRTIGIGSSPWRRKRGSVRWRQRSPSAWASPYCDREIDG